MRWIRTFYRNHIFVASSAAILVFCLDIISKWCALFELTQQRTQVVIPGFFNFSLTMNKGVAFGMFSQLPDFLRILALCSTTLIALGVLVWIYRRYGRYSRWIAGALGLVGGGALGNLLDRLRYGAVVDFLDFYLGNWHWPAFNIADSGICVGVVLLVLLCKD